MGKASRSKAARKATTPTGTMVDRRRRMELAGLTAVVVLGVIILVFTLGGKDGDDESGGQTFAASDDVDTFEVTSRDHVDGRVEYPQTPPVGGDHSPAWQNCGSYRTPIESENAVHSLEHGAVWIAYQPDLAADDIAALEERADGETHVLVSPYEGLSDPIVVSAWGAQLRASSVEDDGIDRFIMEFQEGPQTPEPGAPCSGALGEPR